MGINKEKLRHIMIAGTGSDVGKSVVATAICRVLYEDGFTPAPFKAQNMSLNSYATPDGKEIGRAQAVQAEAACINCSTDMNPILLKPGSSYSSQVILNGVSIGNRSVLEYYNPSQREKLRKEVLNAFNRLATSYNPIVLEGAGSISELNLRASDLVNMSMARDADADIILVADIDKGGVFASTYGSIMLQTPEDKKRIKGIIINKFRGDIKLFHSGIKKIEEICKVPVLGVLPYYDDIYIENEDSVDVGINKPSLSSEDLNIAVVRLKRISNFTDFDLLSQQDGINLYYAHSEELISGADMIIIPGTKSTIEDLKDLYDNGLDKAIIEAYQNGKVILGICGGYQMMGMKINDPYHIESDVESIDGLGLLPMMTTIEKKKITCRSHFTVLDNNVSCNGYQIHMGQTTPVKSSIEYRPLLTLDNGLKEGCWVNERLMGTYMHGILDNPSFLEMILSLFSRRSTELNSSCNYSYNTFKEQQYVKLAALFRQHINMDMFYKILKNND